MGTMIGRHQSSVISLALASIAALPAIIVLYSAQANVMPSVWPLVATAQYG